MESSAIALAAMVFTICIFFSSDVLSALDSSSANRWQLRTRAFNLHPNLEGWIFAGSALIFIRQSFVSKGIKSIFYAITSLLSVMIVLAASARSSLLALGISLIVLTFLFLTQS
jgi:hypothetical protein